MFKNIAGFVVVLSFFIILTGCGKTSPSEPVVNSTISKSELPSELLSNVNRIQAGSLSSTPTAAYSIRYQVDAISNSSAPIGVYYSVLNSYQYEEIYSTPWYRDVTVTASSCFIYTTSPASGYKKLSILKNSKQLAMGAAQSTYHWIIGYLNN